MVLAGRWRKLAYDQILAIAEQRHIVPKLAKRVFKVFVKIITLRINVFSRIDHSSCNVPDYRNVSPYCY